MSLHLQLPIILVAAVLAGAVGRRLGIPAVVSQIIVGVVLGPSLVGWLPGAKSGGQEISVLLEVARVGLCVLLFKIGLETDFKLFRRVWRQATVVAISGMAMPLLAGWGVAVLLGWTHHSAWFAGATLTATSIGLTAAVLEELRVQSSREATIILGAAVLDDVLGLVLLTMLASVFAASSSVVGATLAALGQAVGFLLGGLLLGPYIVQGLIRLAAWAGARSMLVVLAFAYLLLLAFLAEQAGLAMILGAYAAGLAFSGHTERNQLEVSTEPLITLFTPLYFVLVGASVELQSLMSGTGPTRGMPIAWMALLLLLVAIAGKVFSTLVLRDARLNRLAIGCGMLPRGEVGLIFAQVGLESGAFTKAQFSVVVVVIIATTLIGPFLLRWALNKSVNQSTQPAKGNDSATQVGE